MLMLWLLFDLAQPSTHFLRLSFIMGSWPWRADYLLISLISLEVRLVIFFESSYGEARIGSFTRAFLCISIYHTQRISATVDSSPVLDTWIEMGHRRSTQRKTRTHHSAEVADTWSADRALEHRIVSLLWCIRLLWVQSTVQIARKTLGSTKLTCLDLLHTLVSLTSFLGRFDWRIIYLHAKGVLKSLNRLLVSHSLQRRSIESAWIEHILGMTHVYHSRWNLADNLLLNRNINLDTISIVPRLSMPRSDLFWISNDIAVIALRSASSSVVSSLLLIPLSLCLVLHCQLLLLLLLNLVLHLHLLLLVV